MNNAQAALTDTTDKYNEIVEEQKKLQDEYDKALAMLDDIKAENGCNSSASSFAIIALVGTALVFVKKKKDN